MIRLPRIPVFTRHPQNDSIRKVFISAYQLPNIPYNGYSLFKRNSSRMSGIKYITADEAIKVRSLPIIRVLED
jgi:hypothetical protein